MSDNINLTRAIETALEQQNDDTYSYEPTPNVFHPSQVGKCKRQMFLSKLDQHYFPYAVQGKFTTGTLIHEWIEDNVKETLRQRGLTPLFEHQVEFEHDGLQFKGRADFYNPETDTVVDFKTRANWYNFDMPVQRHLDQVYTYMMGLTADQGKIVYIRKKDFDLKEYPTDGKETGRYFDFDPNRWTELVEKCHDVKEAVEQRVNTRKEGDYVHNLRDVPFDKCDDCYVCRHEDEKIENREYVFLRKETQPWTNTNLTI